MPQQTVGQGIVSSPSVQVYYSVLPAGQQSTIRCVDLTPLDTPRLIVDTFSFCLCPNEYIAYAAAQGVTRTAVTAPAYALLFM